MINSNDDSMLFIDASTGELVNSIESPGGRQSTFTFHPSGDSLVTLSGDTEDQRKLSICYLPNGEYRKFTIHKHYWSTVPSISPDGQLLALASDFQAIDIWDLTSLTKVYSCHVTCVKYTAWIHTVSHPQAFLILGSADISIWGFDTKHQMFKLMSLTGIKSPDAVTVSRDRTCCAVAQKNDLVLYSWGSFITVQKVARFDRSKDVYDASWVGDGLTAICGDFGIELWDLEAEKLVAQVSSDFTRTICYGGNRQLASLGFQNGTLKIWSLDAILSHSEPVTQRSASRVKAFIALPSGKVAAISNNGTLDMLSVASDGKFHHVPKTVPNMPSGSFYIPRTLAFGPSDCFALATNCGAIHIFNLDHRTGLYYCERRIEEHLAAKRARKMMLFWGEEQIITFDDDINFWDLKTGRYLRKVCISHSFEYCISTITADSRIAGDISRCHLVIWDIMSGKETQCFDLCVLQLDFGTILKVSLDSSALIAVFTQSFVQGFIAIGNAKNGTWIRVYSLVDHVTTLTFVAPKLLDTGFGVLEYEMECGSSRDIPNVTAEDHWDPRYLRLSCSKSEAWLMKGSMRILWIPRQDIEPRRFSIQTNFETGKSTVILIPTQ